MLKIINSQCIISQSHVFDGECVYVSWEYLDTNLTQFEPKEFSKVDIFCDKIDVQKMRIVIRLAKHFDNMVIKDQVGGT